MQMREKTQIMTEEDIRRALVRISHEIVEQNKGVQNLVIIGVARGGDILARRIARIIEEIENAKVPVGTIDITLYRDDLDHRMLDDNEHAGNGKTDRRSNVSSLEKHVQKKS